VLGNRDRAVTFGINWYPFRFLKVQGNFIREEISDPLRGPLPSQTGFWSQVFRVQLSI
jgi:hypothetical protein